MAAAAGVCQRGGGAGHLQPGGGAAEGLPGLVPGGAAALWGVSGRAGGRGPRTAGPVAHTHTRRQEHLRGKPE